MSDQATPAAPNSRPRDSFVVDTKPLGRRPGAMREEFRTVPAPADLALEMIGVPEGSDMELDLRLEAVMEGVLASGTVRAALSGECARCLDPVTAEVEVGFQELYVYPESQEAGEEESRLDGELMNLEPAVRDAVVLALPLSPLCGEDCPGLCAECGARLADAGPGHEHAKPIDPRWQALQTLLDTTEDT